MPNVDAASPAAVEAGEAGEVRHGGIRQIDFHHFIHGSAQDKRQIALAIDAALATDGFLYLCNHGIDQAKIDKCFDQSKRFFAQSTAEKESIVKSPSHSRYCGYSRVGDEKIHGRVCMKEGFTWQKPDAATSHNQWPAEAVMSGFQGFMEDFHQDCARLMTQLLDCLSLALNLPSDQSLARYHTECNCSADVIRYPSISAALLRSGEASRCPAHADFGGLTLLFQDDVGGLEIIDPSSTNTATNHTETTVKAEQRGRFRHVDPKSGTIVVNVGHILMRWSNGRWKNTIHRVSAPPSRDWSHSTPSTDPSVVSGGAGDAEIIPERYSIAFFSYPDYSTVVDALPGCWSAENPKRWKPLHAGDYLARKLRSSFG